MTGKICFRVDRKNVVILDYLCALFDDLSETIKDQVPNDKMKKPLSNIRSILRGLIATGEWSCKRERLECDPGLALAVASITHKVAGVERIDL